MGVVGLTWYIGALSTLLAIISSAITWAPPGPGPLERAAPIVFAAGAALGAGVAVGLGRLPRTHWIRQSRSVWAVLLAIAATFTLMVTLVG